VAGKTAALIAILELPAHSALAFLAVQRFHKHTTINYCLTFSRHMDVIVSTPANLRLSDQVPEKPEVRETRPTKIKLAAH
jgi:hypothetical protein